MVYRVEVGLRKEISDPVGKTLLRRIKNDFGIESVKDVRVLKVYLTDVEGTMEEEAKEFSHQVLTDPVTEISEMGETIADGYRFDWIVETGFLPGVTDNEGKTALWGFRKLFDLKGVDNDRIFAGRKYLFSGDISKNDIETIASGLLYNKLIQRCKIIHVNEWKEGQRIGNVVPRVKGETEIKVETVDLDVSDNELVALSKVRVLALSLEEMKAIQAHFRDPEVKKYRKEHNFPQEPTDCEVEVLAQTWSEHCKHKIFAANINYKNVISGEEKEISSLYKSYIKQVTKELQPEKEWVKSVFHDNAGIIEIDDENLLAMKVETHNSPSALDPYGGALTGIVGVNRDIIGSGIGAKPIFNTDVFCFASPFYSGDLPGNNLMHPSRIFRGVHQGVKDGGNESGIPVVNGSIFFDNRFIGKPLVFCGTGGLMPKEVNEKPAYEKKAQVGDLVVMTGGRVGKDGIHGATFSSEELHEGSPATAVQIGDPIVQKRMLDFIMEARDKGLFSAITDNGAGGLSSSVGEMAEDTGGAKLNLEKVPLKYAGLQPWEIFISEAQERMTLAVPEKHFAYMKELADIHEVEITAIGNFTDSGYLELFYEDKPVALLNMQFLHDGVPKYQLDAVWERREDLDYTLSEYDDYNQIMLDMIGRLNIASKEDWVRQYDHEVQGRSAGKPFCGKDADGPSDAAVVRISPFKKTAVVVSHGMKPAFSDIDTYWMSASAIDEAVRNAVSVGADPDFMSGLDNFCWPDPVYHKEKNPDGKDKMAALVRSNEALYDYCKAFKIPLISGKDSMKNDYGTGKNKISIPPTLLFTLISRMNNVENMLTMDFKHEGSLIYILGKTGEEMGASEYFEYHGMKRKGTVPRVEADEFLDNYRALYTAVNKNLVESAHDLSDGGLAVTLAESAFAGGLGAKVDLRKVPLKGRVRRDDYILFSESNGRILVSVSPEDKNAFEDVMKERATFIGEVTASEFMKVTGRNENLIINLSINELKKCWKGALGKLN